MKSKIHEPQKTNKNFVSKNYFKTTIAIALLTIIFSSCSKDNDQPAPTIETKAGNYRLTSATSENAKYQYDAQGRVNKIYGIDDLPQKTISYNSNNQLEKVVDVATSNPNQINTYSYNYNVGGLLNLLLADITTVSTYVNNADEQKIRRIYDYNPSKVLDGSILFEWNNATYTFENPSNVHTYIINAQGYLTRINFGVGHWTEYNYDNNGNVVEEIYFKVHLRAKTIYTYDNKKNPLHNLMQKIDPETVTSPNNLVSKNVTKYNSDGTIANTVLEGGAVISGVVTTNYTYEYNDGGYPTKQISPTETNLFNYQKL